MTKLEEIRRIRGYSQNKLALKAGVTRAYISYLEADPERIENATFKKIKAIARALDVHYTDLLND